MNDEPILPVSKPRGFAAISPERQRELAKRGGQSVSADKRYYTTNKEAAREAGRRGAAVKQANYLARMQARLEEKKTGEVDDGGH
jgi:general stress protein YciG